jgi:DNA-binding transcriptional regulator YdaS (Cro superfamily)
MTYDQLLAVFKTQRAAANAIGVSKQAVSQWKRKGIPRDSQINIEVKTGGKLRADLPQEVRQSA